MGFFNKTELEIASDLAHKGQLGDAARLYEKLGYYSEAALLYRQLQRYGRSAALFELTEDYLGAAESYELSGDFSNAAKMYEQAGAYLRAAELYEKNENWLDAGDMYKRLRQYILAGMMFDMGKDYDSAIEMYQYKFADGKRLWEYMSDVSDRPAGICLSPAARYVTIGFESGIYYFDRVGTLLWIRQLFGGISEIAANMDNSRIVVGLKNDKICLLDEDGDVSWERITGDGYLYSVDINARGNQIAGGSKILYLLDENGREIWKLDTNSTIYKVLFSPQENFLAIGLWQEFWLLNPNNGKILWKTSFGGSVNNIAFTLDENYLMFSSSTGVYLIDTNKGKVLWNRSDSGANLFAFTSDLSRMAITEDENILIYDEEQKSIMNIKTSANISKMCFTDDGHYIFATSRNGLHLFTVHNGKKVWESLTEDSPLQMKIASNGDYVIACSMGNVHLYSIFRSAERLIELYELQKEPEKALELKRKLGIIKEKKDNKKLEKAEKKEKKEKIKTYSNIKKLNNILYYAKISKTSSKTSKDVLLISISNTKLSNPQKEKIFWEKLKKLQKIKHPNLLPIMQLDIIGKRIAYTYTAGYTLADYLAKHNTLIVKNIKNLTLQILKSLQIIHQLGITHHNIIPELIWIGKDNKIRLLGSGLLMPSSILPEMLWGNIPDHRGDIYNIGVLMYECLTGNEFLQLDRMTYENIPSTKEIEALKEIIKCCLEEDPNNRYANVKELAEALFNLGKTPLKAEKPEKYQKPKINLDKLYNQATSDEEVNNNETRELNKTMAMGIKAKIPKRYDILEILGKGGMGIVYKALDKKLERIIAIKTLPSHLNADADTLTRFIREAKTTASINHPNIVHIYDIDEEGFYMLIEYIEGYSLRQILKKYQSLPIEDVILIGQQASSALWAVHQRGIVHRDIKPENIMLKIKPLAVNGSPLDKEKIHIKITDFGIARIDDSTMTHTGMIIGTLCYMSPEQIQGSRNVDARSDIYSLGIVLYELLSGERPKRNRENYIPLKKLVKVANDLEASILDRLEYIIRKCIDDNKNNRWNTANDLKQALEQIHDTETISEIISTSTNVNRWQTFKDFLIMAWMDGALTEDEKKFLELKQRELRITDKHRELIEIEVKKQLGTGN